MEHIDAIRINFNEGSLVIMNLCLAFIMFGIALDLKISEFRRVRKFPKALFIGLSSQLILLPLITIALIKVWEPMPSMALGLVMIAVCPGGNISNFAVHLSGGNTALSVTMTSLVTLSAWVITPAAFSAWASLVPSTRQILSGIYVGPLDMVWIIIQLILIPLIIGMLLSHFQPGFANRARKPVKKISLLIFTAFIFFALAGNYRQIVNYLGLVFTLVVVHNSIALAAGYSWASAFGLREADRKAICLETGIQNAGLGLVLVLAFFSHLGGMLLVAAFWGVWNLVSAFLISIYWNRRSR